MRRRVSRIGEIDHRFSSTGFSSRPMEIFTEKRTRDLRVAGSFVVRTRGGSLPGCCSLQVSGRNFLRNKLRCARPRGIGRSPAPLPWRGAPFVASPCDEPARLRQGGHSSRGACPRIGPVSGGRQRQENQFRRVGRDGRKRRSHRRRAVNTQPRRPEGEIVHWIGNKPSRSCGTAGPIHKAVTSLARIGSAMEGSQEVGHDQTTAS